MAGAEGFLKRKKLDLNVPSISMASSQIHSLTKDEVGILGVDVPKVYLTSKSKWNDFVDALDNCSIAWGLPDWKSTLLVG